MKKCKNPYCECEQTFPDTVQLCPFCGSALSPEGEDESPPQLHTAEELPIMPASATAQPLVTAGAFGAQGTAGPFGGNGAQQSLSQFLS